MHFGETFIYNTGIRTGGLFLVYLLHCLENSFSKAYRLIFITIHINGPRPLVNNVEVSK